MIKERIPISGDLKSKVKQLMEYAGWQEGRKVDISIAEQYYADHGIPMMKTTQRFYRKYFGLCCEWYLEQKKLNWAADFQFALFPYLVNGIKNHLEEAYFRDMSGCELAEIEQAAGEKCQPIGHIGYYYPAEVWISEYGKLYAKYLLVELVGISYAEASQTVERSPLAAPVADALGVAVFSHDLPYYWAMLIDTVGMSTLFLPDLQYHFHDMDPNWVANHAYNVASYILEHDNPIQDGETVDGVADGQMSREIQWKCQYEDALIQPPRGVLDINMGEFAAGQR